MVVQLVEIVDDDVVSEEAGVAVQVDAGLDQDPDAVHLLQGVEQPALIDVVDLDRILLLAFQKIKDLRAPAFRLRMADINPVAKRIAKHGVVVAATIPVPVLPVHVLDDLLEHGLQERRVPPQLRHGQRAPTALALSPAFPTGHCELHVVPTPTCFMVLPGTRRPTRPITFHFPIRQQRRRRVHHVIVWEASMTRSVDSRVYLKRMNGSCRRDGAA